MIALGHHLERLPVGIVNAIRLLLAVSALVLSWIDQDYLGFRVEMDDIFAIMYVSFALTVACLYLYSWWIYFNVRKLIFYFDLTCYFLVMILVEPMHSGYFAGSIMMISFLAISSTVQFGVKPTFVLISILNLVCIAMSVQMTLMHGESIISSLMRRQIYQLLISYFMIWATNIIHSPRVRFRAKREPLTSITMSSTLQNVLNHVGAKSGALCWAANDQTHCKPAIFSDCEASQCDQADCSADFTNHLENPALFSLSRGVCVTLDSRGSAKVAELGKDEVEFATRYGIVEGIYIPLNGASGNGRLIVRMPRIIGVDILPYMNELGGVLTQVFDNLSHVRLAETRRLEEVRRGVARDLHDNVAQSLAGARLWLDAIHSKSLGSEAISNDVQALSEMLKIEHARLNQTVRYLRAPEAMSGQIDLTQRLAHESSRLSRIWKVEITTSTWNDPIISNAAIGMDVSAIAQEAVSNAVRHGQATEINFHLSRHLSELILKVSDNGQGFQKGFVTPDTISQRLVALGGTAKVSRELGKTVICMTIPVGGT